MTAACTPRFPRKRQMRLTIIMCRRSLTLTLAVLVAALASAMLHAQKPQKDNRSGYDRSARATVLHTANVYVTADDGTPPVVTVGIGHEVVVLEHSGGWVRVFANTDKGEDEDDDTKPEFEDAGTADLSTGWIRDKGIVGPTTPNGDALIYGAAADLEAAAAQPLAPKNAADDARLLYKRVADYFPSSPLAAEAAFRSADIRWQIDKMANSDLPSAHEQDPGLRPQVYDGELKKVMKRFPQSPFAARAAFDLLDAKLCGDWQGLPKCPQDESVLYEKYADRYPGGPKSAEALYDAAYRQGVLVTMYAVDEDAKRSAAALKNCAALAAELRANYPQSDYTPRAESIAFRAAQGIPIIGNDRD